MDKELRSLLFEMKRKNLTVEAKKIEKIMAVSEGETTYDYYQVIAAIHRESDFDAFKDGRKGFLDADENKQFNYLMQHHALDEDDRKIHDRKPWTGEDDIVKIKRGNELYYIIFYHKSTEDKGYGIEDSVVLVRLIPEDEYEELDIF